LAIDQMVSAQVRLAFDRVCRSTEARAPQADGLDPQRHEGGAVPLVLVAVLRPRPARLLMLASVERAVAPVDDLRAAGLSADVQWMVSEGVPPTVERVRVEIVDERANVHSIL
jgi:hypothetical protein